MKKKRHHKKRKYDPKKPGFVAALLQVISSRLGHYVILVSLLCISMSYLYVSYMDRVFAFVNHHVVAFHQKAGLVIDNIYLEGQAHTSKGKLLDAVALKKNQPLFRVDLWEAKRSLEALPWVEYAVVERQLPSTIVLRIVEREPLALWQHQKQLKLIDTNGKVIQNADIKQFGDLVVVVGEDASSHASALMSVIRGNKPKAYEVASAVRVGKRRWDVQMENGLKLRLPEHGMHDAWQHFVKLSYEQPQKLKQSKIIDLKVHNRMYMQ